MNRTESSSSHDACGRSKSQQTAWPAVGLILAEACRSTPSPRPQRVEAERDQSSARLRLVFSDTTHDHRVTASRLGMGVPVSPVPTMGQLGVPDTCVTADIDNCRDPRLLSCADVLHGEWRAHRPGAQQLAESLLARNPGCSLVVLCSDFGRGWLIADRTCSRRFAFSRSRHARLSAQTPLFVACLHSWLSSGHLLQGLASVTEALGQAD